MKEENKWPGILLNIGIPAATVAAVVFFGPRLISFFMPFLIGWIIAMIANPLVRFLERHVRIRRKASSVVLIVGVLALIVLGGYAGIRAIVLKAAEYIKQLPELINGVGLEIQRLLQTNQLLVRWIPVDTRITLIEACGELNETIVGLAAGFSEPAIGAAGTVARNIPAALVYFVVTLMSAYFFIVEHEQMKQKVAAYIPKSLKNYWAVLRQKLSGIVGGYFLAQFKIMFVVAAILFVGFLVLQVPYSIPLAVGISFLDFLPVFGTGTVLIPWAVFTLIEGDIPFTVGLAALYAVTQVVRQLIQPKIVGDSMGLNPLLTLFLLYVGFRVKGLGGMILAVPVGLFVIELYRAGAFDSFKKGCRDLVEEIRKIRGV